MKSSRFLSVLCVLAVVAMAAGRAVCGDGMAEPEAKDGSPNMWAMFYLVIFAAGALVVAFKPARRTRVS